MKLNNAMSLAFINKSFNIGKLLSFIANKLATKDPLDCFVSDVFVCIVIPKQ